MKLTKGAQRGALPLSLHPPLPPPHASGTVVSTGDSFAPQHLQQSLEKCSIITLGGEELLTSREKRSGGLFNTRQCYTASLPLTSKNFQAQNVNAPVFEKLCPSPLTLKIDYVQMVSSCSIQVLNSPLGFQSALHHWFLS